MCREQWAWIFTANISRILSSFEKRKLPSRDLLCQCCWKMWFKHRINREQNVHTYGRNHTSTHTQTQRTGAADDVKINSISHSRNFPPMELLMASSFVVVVVVVNFSVIYGWHQSDANGVWKLKAPPNLFLSTHANQITIWGEKHVAGRRGPFLSHSIQIFQCTLAGWMGWAGWHRRRRLCINFR